MRRLLLGALALAMLCAAPAQAAWFPSEPIDGPSADIVSFGDVDTAQDGGSAVVYLKRGGGVPKVWASRMVNGAWQPPEQLDVGQGSASSDPHVSVSDGGRVVAAWINQGRVWSAVREAGAPGWTEPIQVYPGPAQRLSLSMSVHGVGYLAFSVGGGSRDVRAARLTGTNWTNFDQVLDVEPGRDAGGGRGPRIAAAADGTALAAWEEVGGDGRTRVQMRRVLRDRLSQFPAEVSVNEIEGHPAGNSRSPEVGMDWDSSFGWVVFEEDFQDGGVWRSRIVGRRVVGVGFDDETKILDALQWGGADNATDPDVDVTGRLRAFAASEITPYAGVSAAVLQIDVFGVIGRIDSPAGAQTPDPTVAHASNGEGAFLWHEDGQVIGRYWNRDEVLEDGSQLANGEFGAAQPSLGIDSSADRAADVAVGFVQGGPLERRIVVAHWDRPLRAITPASATQAWQPNRRPRLTWGNATELWGAAQYRIDINGVPVATQESNVLNLPFDLPDGSHSWRITTIDRRGQETPGTERRLNIDATRPVAAVATTGTLRAGQAIRFVARDDPPPQPVPQPGQPVPPPVRTSGLERLTASFGDRGRATGTREVRHVFMRKGSYRVRLVVRDRAGNQAIVKLLVKVANAKKKGSSSR
ncbi:MAG TPA: PKD domain-containing protein [Thermoleophilaceae bacterium]